MLGCIFDSLHNAGVNILKKYAFLHQVLADILCVKMAFGTIFSLQIIEVFILFAKALLW